MAGVYERLGDWHLRSYLHQWISFEVRLSLVPHLHHHPAPWTPFRALVSVFFNPRTPRTRNAAGAICTHTHAATQCCLCTMHHPRNRATQCSANHARLQLRTESRSAYVRWCPLFSLLLSENTHSFRSQMRACHAHTCSQCFLNDCIYCARCGVIYAPRGTLHEGVVREWGDNKPLISLL